MATTEFMDSATSAKAQNNSNPSTCSQCGRGLGKSPRGATKTGSPATPKGPSRSRARNHSESGCSTPKSRSAAAPKTPPVNKHLADPYAEPKLPEQSSTAKTAAFKASSDDGVFRVPQMPCKQSLTKGATLTESEQLLQQISNMQKQSQTTFMIPQRPRMKRNLRKPLIVQRRLLPKANTPSRQIVSFTIGQNGSVMSLVPPSVGELGSFSQLPPPGGTVIRSPTGRTIVNREGIPTVTSSAGQRVVARQIVAQPEFIELPDPSSSFIESSIPATESTASMSDVTNLSSAAVKLNFGSSALHNIASSLVTASGNDAQHLNTVSLSDAALPPPSISSLLDISLPAPEVTDGVAAEKLIDIALENTASFTGFLESSPLKIGEDGSMSMYAVPSRSGHVLSTSLHPENAWLNGELQDFSLSNFLDQTPVKKPVVEQSQASSSIICESSRDSIASRFDVDSALQSMMNENSLDYVAKFADLAAQIAANVQEAESGAKTEETF